MSIQDTPHPLTKKRNIGWNIGLVCMCSLVGFAFGWIDDPHWQPAILWTLGGLFFGLMVLGMDHLILQYPFPAVYNTILGTVSGLFLAAAFSWFALQLLPESFYHAPAVILASLIFFPYLGFTLGLRATREHPRSKRLLSNPSRQTVPTLKILDTSAIIDGRILELCTTGFIEGPVVVPQFILIELQAIANSTQDWRRNCGKRGLDVLEQLQSLSGIPVQFHPQDYPHIDGVGDKLIRFAKHLNGKIVTTDWNLTKEASLEGVRALNVNELSYQFKPPVLPGEVIRVFINKEGQSPRQGVAHLDDGSLVVVDEGFPLIGKVVEVVITKLMQTSSGRVVFASLQRNHDKGEVNGCHEFSLGNREVTSVVRGQLN